MENRQPLPSARRSCPRPLFLLLILMTAGCGGIGVRRANTPGLFEAWRVSAVADDISPRTLQTLRRWDLDALYRQHPEQALAPTRAVCSAPVGGSARGPC